MPVARCSIHQTKPEVCKEYPKVDHYIPEECTYHFIGSERRGDCSCNVGACCALPRENGEPGGVPLPSIAGGLPCKHLVWKEEGSEPTKEKSAGVAPSKSTLSILYDLVGGPRDDT